MEEGDVQPLSTLAGSLVNQTDTLLRNFSEGIGNAVLNAEGYVMNALVAFVNPLLDSALWGCWLQQFEFHLAAF